MGRLGRNLSNDIKEFITQQIETRYGYNQSATTYLPPGEDSVPIKDDRIVLVQVDGKGSFVAVGVLAVSQGAKAGEKILYSRSENGEVKAAIKLLNDGKIEMLAPGDLSITGDGKLEIKAKEAAITGGQLKVNGSAAPTGSGPFCAVAVCPMTGAPHVGNTVSGT